MHAHILMVDDDRDICDLVSRFFGIKGYTVHCCYSGRGIWEVLDKVDVSLIILDLHLPDVDGFNLARELRERCSIPIIMLTARDKLMDRIYGLEIGADDYVVKPFELEEVAARVKAILRRVERERAREPFVTEARVTNETTETNEGSVQDQSRGDTVVFGEWRFNRKERCLVSDGGHSVYLTPTEIECLEVFISRPNEILSRNEISMASRGRELGPSDRSVDIHVARLRQKIDGRNKGHKFLRTVHNQGYMFVLPDR